ACPTTWPGGTAVTAVDVANTFSSNLSDFMYEAFSGPDDVLWGIRNGPSTLYRLMLSGGNWVSDPTNGWSNGKQLRYPSGTGDPDAEGVTFTTGSSAGMYVSTERDNNNGGVSRPAILLFDVSGSTTELVATKDWNLTSDLPGLGPNLGAEAV